MAAPVGKRTRIKREELIYFTMQLSVMVDTGVPLSEALQSLADQSFSENFTAVIKSVVQDVTGGKDLSIVLEGFPRIFPKYYVSLVRASELSGTMGPMLRKLADYLTAQRETSKKVKGALIYPGFMFIMSIGVTIFLLTAILPKFTAIFASRKAALPMPTQVLMAISHSLIFYWYFWIFGSVAVVAAATYFLSTAVGQRFADFAKLRIPIFGPMFSQAVSVAVAFDHGNDDHLRRAAAGFPGDRQGGRGQLLLSGNVGGGAAQRCRTGRSFPNRCLSRPWFPKSVAQMIFSGEKTG